MTERGKTILLVEDDRFLRRAAEATLKRSGFTVVVAADGEEALRVVGPSRPDLILLDLIMPKIQGFEVLRRLKEDPDDRGGAGDRAEQPRARERRAAGAAGAARAAI